MNALVTRQFWDYYHHLSREVQRTAKKQFKLWRKDPYYPSLQFKQLHGKLYSARINDGVRALGRMEGNTFTWHWIGGHDEYERMIARL